MYSQNLTSDQKLAVLKAIQYKFSLITGYPGTGKSTIVKEVIDSVEDISEGIDQKNIELTDPKNLQNYFDSYVSKAISNNGYFPEQRSVNRLKNSIYTFCESNFSLKSFHVDRDNLNKRFLS